MPQKVISQTAGRVFSSAMSPFHFYLVRIAICSTCQGLAESKKEEALVGDVLGRSNSQGNSSRGSVANNGDDKGGSQGIPQS